ncbi:MAG: hypothetical protein JWN71_3099 [Xanthobacteraceae bacterium]|nr:hypothetical protein [Xanthobacteraceae bacterium]
MLLFCLEDPVTGEIKNLAAPDGTTEPEARARYGGIWLDASRTLCSPPCRVGRARKAAVASDAVSLASARQQAAKARRLAGRFSGQRVA